MPNTIDLTPSWTDILPLWLNIARDAAITGNVNSWATFTDEMRRMAAGADAYREYCQRTDMSAGVEPCLHYEEPEHV